MRARRRGRGSRHALVGVAIGAGLAAACSAAACGSRTGLTSGEIALSGSAVGEGGGGAPTDMAGTGGVHVPPPRGGGGSVPEAGPDVIHVDDCADAGETAIYAIADDNELFRYDPIPNTTTTIGTIDCIDPRSPFSMGVDRSGVAYVVYNSGNLYEVDTKTAACTQTPLIPRAFRDWATYGMAFSSDEDASTETLYVVESDYNNPSQGLARIDVTTFRLSFIAPVAPELGDAIELTGTGDGELYAFGLKNPGPGSHLAQIDKVTGATISDTELDVGLANSSFAFAFWGGDFYLFTDGGESGPPTTITRWRPSDQTLTPVLQLTNHVVGVGVSTCAPH